MVGSLVEYIYSAVFKTFFINDLKIEFIKEFWPSYLSSVEFFGDGKIYEVLIVYINFHLVFGFVKVKLSFFEWFDDGY